MKSYNVSIQLKTLWQISYIILFISYLYLFLEIFAAVTFTSEKFRMATRSGISVLMRQINIQGFSVFLLPKGNQGHN